MMIRSKRCSVPGRAATKMAATLLRSPTAISYVCLPQVVFYFLCVYIIYEQQMAYMISVDNPMVLIFLWTMLGMDCDVKIHRPPRERTPLRCLFQDHQPPQPCYTVHQAWSDAVKCSSLVCKDILDNEFKGQVLKPKLYSLFGWYGRLALSGCYICWMQ